MKKIILIFVATLLVVSAAVGVIVLLNKNCEHAYDNACDVSCNKCGEERAVSHEFTAADCDSPKTCSICHATEGEALGHTWTAADCDSPKTCSICNATEGEELGHTWTAADCDSPKTCSVCKVTEGEKLGHKDENKDHACDNACGKNDMGTHGDSASDSDHLCDYGCGAVLDACADKVGDKDHKCDVCGKADVSDHIYGDATCETIATCTECGATTGSALDHKDENKDHVCDRNCGKNDMGTHADSASDGDHVCDYGCGAVLEACADKAGDKDHKCDVCGEAGISDHSYGYATCTAPKTCTECGATTGSALGHKDENKDHVCDRNCGKNDVGAHTDSSSDSDHLCDYGCGAVLEACADKVGDKDHKCDVCGKAGVSVHTYSGATCTECGAKAGSALDHKDENKDHLCDNACGKNDMGTHADSSSDSDHLCDYGCGAVLESCVDKAGDKDHKCDVCGKTDVSDHTYADATCTAPKTCTECGSMMGEPLGHKDENKDHICDNACGKTDMGAHADSASDSDHLCDYGCGAVVEACADKVGDHDHKCDVCGKDNVSEHTYGEATCETTAICTECGATTGEPLGHKDENKDHVCDNGCGKNGMGAHADSASDNDHVCDYGCGAVLEACADKVGDHDHKCDACGKADISAHTAGEWEEKIPETISKNGVKIKNCTECGAKELETEVIYATGSVGLKYELNTKTNTYTLTSIGTCTDTNVVIAAFIDGKPVTAIGGYGFDRSGIQTVSFAEGSQMQSIGSFKECASLKSIKIPDSVTSIDSTAFWCCGALTTVDFGAESKLTSIGAGAFMTCPSLTSIEIPASVTSIGDSAFSGCSSLVSIALPEGVTSIGKEAFYNCSKLASVTIPDSVTSIGDYAFDYCKSLASIELPSGLTSIGTLAFRSCTSLTSIVIPGSLTYIGLAAFGDCTSLTSVTILNGVTKIDAYIFTRCTSLTSITIPDSVTSIDSGAFAECTSLVSITIPNSMTSIGNSAFRWCDSLTSITIPNSVMSIGSSAFYGCKALTDIRYGGTVEQWNAIAFGEDWNYNTSKYKIICTDGTIAKPTESN